MKCYIIKYDYTYDVNLYKEGMEEIENLRDPTNFIILIRSNIMINREYYILYNQSDSHTVFKFNMIQKERSMKLDRMRKP